jgi:hypothetical protein
MISKSSAKKGNTNPAHKHKHIECCTVKGNGPTVPALPERILPSLKNHESVIIPFIPFGIYPPM